MLNQTEPGGAGRRPLVWSVGAVFVGVLVFLLVTGGELTFDSDSVFYWSAARTLLERHQLATGIAYDRSAIDATLARGELPPALDPFTAFAPGYPVVVAAVAWGARVNVADAALCVNLLAVAIILWLVTWLGRRVGGPAVGFVAAMTVGLLPCFSGTVRSALSEAQFAALILGALACLIVWLDDPGAYVACVYAACVLGAAATYTRYIGITFFILAVVIAAYRLLAVGRDRTFLHAVAAIGAYGLLIIPLAARNVSLTGTLGGAVHAPSERGLLTNMSDLLRGIFDALPLARRLVAGPLDTLVSASLLALVIISAVDWTELGRAIRTWRPAASTGVIALFALIYGVFLVILRSDWAFEPIERRLLFPALLVTVILGVNLGRLAIRPNRRVVVSALWLIVAAIAALADWSSDFRSSSVNSVWMQNHPVILAVREHVRSAPERPRLIFADDIYAVHFATGRPVYRLPSLVAVRGLRANQPGTDLLFVIGPSGPRASLDDAEGKAYGRELEKMAVLVRAGEDYGVWDMPAVEPRR